MVERFNRILCESLAKITEGQENWDKHISPILFAYRTAKQSSTKMTPFYLVYGRNPQVPPMEMDEVINNNILSRLFTLIEDLSQEREAARRNISKAQRRQKEYHDQRKNLAQPFKISDKVLMYDAARDKHFTGKLKPKWKGPYYIHDVLRNGTYKLRTMDGKVLVALINTQLLKKYHDREAWEPQILLENYQQQ